MSIHPLFAAVLATALAGAWPAWAQAPVDTVEGPGARRVEAARWLAEDGAPELAAYGVAAYLREHPGDAGARWLLARYLYWAGWTEAAAEQYERAMGVRPDDAWLRLEYAQMLLAVGPPDSAVAVAEPALESGEPAARAAALALVGTADYWAGELSRAAARFEAALALDPSQSEAARQLEEIRAASRPWVTAAGALLDDNQPYRRLRGGLEAGVYATPLWTVGAGLVPMRLDASEASGPAVGAAAAWIEVGGAVPAAGLRVRGRLGGWWTGVLDPSGGGGGGPGRGPFMPGPRLPTTPDKAAWLGAGELSVALPAALTLRLAGSRDRYVATAASADSLVMVDAVELRIDRADHPGWAGEGVVRSEWYADDNQVRTVYGWLLAPVAPGVRAGYAVSWQDAAESRWSVPAGGGAARYAPYYTPERVRVHSLLGELTLGPGPHRLKVSGRYGVRARERAPAVDPTGQDVVVSFTDRSFGPWELRADLKLAATDRLAVDVAAAREQTAAWAQNRLALTVTYRFPGP